MLLLAWRLCNRQNEQSNKQNLLGIGKSRSNVGEKTAGMPYAIMRYAD
jgi:hypothetical protein